MPFQKGKVSNPAGCPKGAHHTGRPPDWLRKRCQEAGPRVVEFLEQVALGEDVEQVITENGETVKVPAPVKERIKAGEILLNRGYGMPNQPIEVTDAQSELAPIPTSDLREVFQAFFGGTTEPTSSGIGAKA